ncbi:MAG: phosphomannomutase/phosphoglucomutase [Propionicimonas sp.]|uniref:phosphomannomutase/phosphoglucomutase n=1 Tax=Propionicimonas sp. TaxID=1955623 RepID=UPI001DA3544E|nr:phosphomannomutase/phosphoglucomutase [Propionicimonas sp.]MBU4187569.1 phosphomannomutase/phosphoglucomutase [Actinomycetota bacterium]MBU4206971.1 phosphomannomutase/phosphoglucomutase [Actinomycetota bacterium]MBU4251007.1 phosphomannomutase/phosphoglucomutase [Actinomycetota bacterium]MBU4364557.1 phosphomannomutase/phosphoglucomutase [Actinomycetota bacterium]MBU4410357.1 phosphomannomutase/phosphoglucomutase [Actinomycetota bacterium]
MIEPVVFKANDIRGVVSGAGIEWDTDGARAVGAAFAEAFELRGAEFVMGRDMRAGGPELAQAFAMGAMSRGASVIDIGLASTDGLWFASGHLGIPGVQFTASHNPANYNGIKFCQALAAPITPELMARIKELTYTELPPTPESGSQRKLDLLDAYAARLHSLVGLDGIRRLKVVVDAGNGMAGFTTPAVLGPLNLELVELFTELDGSFPNHPPNPLEPENLVDAQRAVIEHGADLALVFDGDADRCFIIDEHGAVVSPSVITALIARAELAREPGGVIVINTITSRAVAEVVEAAGGTIAVSTVGHTRMKAVMAARNAIFGGEHSAHYYFRDFWGADTGMLAALHVLAMLGRDSSMSALVSQLPTFAASGEINSTVADPPATMRAVAEALGTGEEVSWNDGLLISSQDWWVSVRESNTEPLLRLNVEAKDDDTVAKLRDTALAIIRKER